MPRRGRSQHWTTTCTACDKRHTLIIQPGSLPMASAQSLRRVHLLPVVPGVEHGLLKFVVIAEVLAVRRAGKWRRRRCLRERRNKRRRGKGCRLPRWLAEPRRGQRRAEIWTRLIERDESVELRFLGVKEGFKVPFAGCTCYVISAACHLKVTAWRHSCRRHRLR